MNYLLSKFQKLRNDRNTSTNNFDYTKLRNFDEFDDDKVYKEVRLYPYAPKPKMEYCIMDAYFPWRRK